MEADQPSTPLVILIAISMLAISMPAAIATHNSVGGSIEISRATQVDEETGELEPEIPKGGYVDRHNNYYHENLANAYGSNLSEDLPTRDGPADGTGAGYTDCKSFAEFVAEGQQDAHQRYEHALPNWADADILRNEGFTDDQIFTTDEQEGAVDIPDDDRYFTTEAVEHREDACWIGLLDKVVEYALAPVILAEQRGDALYPANPHQDDECDSADYILDITTADQRTDVIADKDCSSGGHQQRIGGTWTTAAIDSKILEAPIAGDGSTPNLAEQFEPEGEDSPDRDWYASGSITLPMVHTNSIHLYGYQHPANTDPSPITATWEGWDLPMHGIADSACGLLAAQSDAITEDTARTPPLDECGLLGPQDLKLYDKEMAERSDLSSDNRGRLCTLSPDFGIANAFDAADPSCGPLGTEVTTFRPVSEQGGLSDGQNAPDTGAATYIATTPGWKSPLLTNTPVTNPTWSIVDHYRLMLTANNTDWVKESYDRHIITVNPHVPTIDGDQWCERPQIMTGGSTINAYEGVTEDGDIETWDDWVDARTTEIQKSDDYEDVDDFFATEFDQVSSFEELGELPAPGIYGTYEADAINVDMHGSGLHAVFLGGVYEGHGVPGYNGYGEEVAPVADEAEETLFETMDTLFATANDTLSEADDELEELEGIVEDIQNDAEEEAEAILAIIENILDEAPDVDQDILDLLEEIQATAETLTLLESSDPDPKRLPGPNNYEDFSRGLDAGVGCDGDGSLTFSEEGVTWEGALDFGASIDRFALPALHDPTQTDDEGNSVSESNSTSGTWESNWYSFSGTSFAYVDNTNTGGFSGCDAGNGQPDPNADPCVYDLPWNVPYGTWEDLAANERDRVSDLEDDGFRVNQSEHKSSDQPYGNGLVASVEVTGTTLVFKDSLLELDQNTFLVNDNDPSATTCVVATSGDFHEEHLLQRHVDVNSQGDAPATGPWYEYFCSDDVDNVLHIEDAFLTSSDPAGFFSLVHWIKLAPTPQATADADVADNSGDVLCITSIFSTLTSSELEEIGDGPGVSGTSGNIQLGDDYDTTYYTDCDSLSSEHLGDEYEEESFFHPLDEKTGQLPDFSDKSPAWAGS